jgi:hypothetical protein
VVAGKWHISNSEIEWVDLDAPAEERFPVILPFDLHKHVVIPPKAIMPLKRSWMIFKDLKKQKLKSVIK